MGLYIAAAVLSIAFGQNLLALDGNAVRDPLHSEEPPLWGVFYFGLGGGKNPLLVIAGVQKFGRVLEISTLDRLSRPLEAKLQRMVAKPTDTVSLDRIHQR